MGIEKYRWATALLATILAASAARGNAEDNLLKARPEVVEAWKDMRLGMFVCWGPVSLTGEEIGWSRQAPPTGNRNVPWGGKGNTPKEVYDNLYKTWKPDKFDADEWVRMAGEMGARYMIFLVKHHDGFCLYDTKLTEYRSTGPEAAWKLDVMKQVADACHKAGLKLIVYYSQPDWHHPDYGTQRHDRYIEFLHGQVRELLSNYGRIDGLWFDLGGKPEDWKSVELVKMARGLQPHLILNNRIGLPGDFDTPEQQIGKFQVQRPWESCITLGTQWSWKPNDQIKTLKECIEILVRCAAGDGNLALNTNPMPDGQIEPRQVERFREIGAWLKKYGRSIYGTRGGPWAPGPWGGTTHKDKSIFVHVLRWADDELHLPALPQKIVSHEVLTGGEGTCEQSDKGVVIRVPKSHHQTLDTIVELRLDAPPQAPARR